MEWKTLGRHAHVNVGARRTTAFLLVCYLGNQASTCDTRHTCTKLWIALDLGQLSAASRHYGTPQRWYNDKWNVILLRSSMITSGCLWTLSSSRTSPRRSVTGAAKNDGLTRLPRRTLQIRYAAQFIALPSQRSTRHIARRIKMRHISRLSQSMAHDPNLATQRANYRRIVLVETSLEGFSVSSRHAGQ